MGDEMKRYWHLPANGENGDNLIPVFFSPTASTTALTISNPNLLLFSIDPPYSSVLSFDCAASTSYQTLIESLLLYSGKTHLVLQELVDQVSIGPVDFHT